MVKKLFFSVFLLVLFFISFNSFSLSINFSDYSGADEFGEVYQSILVNAGSSVTNGSIINNANYQSILDAPVEDSSLDDFGASLNDEFSSLNDLEGSFSDDYEVSASYVSSSVLPSSLQSTSSVKPLSTGRVQVGGRQLYVDGKLFQVRGVGYSATPIGMNPEWGYDVTTRPEVYLRDFKRLKEMRANTIRTWGKVNSPKFLDAAWGNGKTPLMVIMGFWLGNNFDYTNPVVRQAKIDEFATYVSAYKDKKAVLAWAIGNEENYFYANTPAKHAAYFLMVNEMAKKAYEIEGSTYHPVIAVSLEFPGQMDTVGNYSKGSGDLNIPYVDIWGINHYPGKTFGNFFATYASKSNKPLIVTEYGIDAFDNVNQREHELVQAEWNLSLWKDINSHSDLVVGGCVMAYSDEWWKDHSGVSVSTHDNGGYATSTHPDGYSNEEWWGIVRPVKKTPTSKKPDLIQPRMAFYAFKHEWSGVNCFANIECNDFNNYTRDVCMQKGKVSSYCTHQPIACLTNSDCGTNQWVGNNFCGKKDIFNTFRTFTCKSPGKINSKCTFRDQNKVITECAVGCLNASCTSTNIIKVTLIAGARTVWDVSSITLSGVRKNGKSFSFTKVGKDINSFTGSYATSSHCISGQTCGWIVGNQVLVGAYGSNPNYWGGSVTYAFDTGAINLDGLKNAYVTVNWPSIWGKGLHSPGTTGYGQILVVNNNKTIATMSTNHTKCTSTDWYSQACATYSVKKSIPLS